MNRPAEFTNPFANPEQSLNQSDMEFIGDVLGPEAQSFFSSLEHRKPGVAVTHESSGEFALTDQELEQIEPGLPYDFWQKLDQAIEVWNENWETIDSRTAFDHWLQTADFARELRLSPRQMQTLCDRILEYADRCIDAKNMGWLFSTILNSSIAALPIEQQASIHLKVGESDGMHYLGTDWANGVLEITESAGNYLGAYMRGGRVIALDADERVGMGMNGGSLEVAKVKDYCGWTMTGGSITVAEASDHVGASMEGGEIHAERVGHSCGNAMQGGVITVDHARNHLGTSMVGGAIIVGEAGARVGYLLRNDAEIHVLKLVASYSPERSGGHIFRPDRTEVPIGETE